MKQRIDFPTFNSSAVCGRYALRGLNNRCKISSFGGIKEIYIADYKDVTGTTVDSGTTLLTPHMYPGRKFKVYSLANNNASMTISMVYNTLIASYYTTTVSMTIPKMDSGNRLESMALANNQLAVIVKDSNDKYWYLGKDNYVEATVGGGNTGQALQDSNNYNYTLEDTSLELPYEVDAECIKDIVGNSASSSGYLEAIYYVLTGEDSPYTNEAELTEQIIILIRELMQIATFEEIDTIFGIV